VAGLPTIDKYAFWIDGDTGDWTARIPPGKGAAGLTVVAAVADALTSLREQPAHEDGCGEST
jgi:hypothetical protein